MDSSADVALTITGCSSTLETFHSCLLCSVTRQHQEPPRQCIICCTNQTQPTGTFFGQMSTVTFFCMRMKKTSTKKQWLVRTQRKFPDQQLDQAPESHKLSQTTKDHCQWCPPTGVEVLRNWAVQGPGQDRQACECHPYTCITHGCPTVPWLG